MIGMTNMPEAKLAREAELPYATVAMVTDYDCWHEEVAAVSVTDPAICKAAPSRPTEAPTRCPAMEPPKINGAMRAGTPWVNRCPCSMTAGVPPFARPPR